ncbi:hypothetical protein NP493_639g02009 [Ridgeia piscesae]|uniref:Uncharacterized protein n=1 Tax=Ridgeia piscesae TaxID=27915 RepID=A0AAD9KSG6_RIDPI|nr:hypothetical protein NP493_639g02009 [Ridgeia piscesae]
MVSYVTPLSHNPATPLDVSEHRDTAKWGRRSFRYHTGADPTRRQRFAHKWRTAYNCLPVPLPTEDVYSVDPVIAGVMWRGRRLFHCEMNLSVNTVSCYHDLVQS